MRKWFAYIERGFRKGYKKGNVIIYNRPSIYSGKGEKRLMELLNIKTGKISKVAVVIGMGYADFKDKKDYEKRIHDIIKKKIKEVIEK